MDNNLIAIITSAIVGGMGFIFHEFIKNLISSYFSNLSKGQINKIFISMVLLIAVLVYPLTNYIAQEAKNKEDEVSKEVTVPKTKEEVYKEIGEAAISKIESIAEKKRKKDSIILANRPQKWVYQIGAPLTELDDVFYKYRLLKDFGNVYVFKESRKTFLLVIDDNASKVNLEEGLQDIVSKVGVIEKDVRVINLMDLCSKKEDIKKVDNITHRKQDVEIPCYECDK